MTAAAAAIPSAIRRRPTASLIDLSTADRSEQTTLGGTTIGDLLDSAEPPVRSGLAVGFAEGVDIGTDVLIDIENATGGAGADTIFGNDNANVLSGGWR